jgi:hypothetical protein
MILFELDAASVSGSGVTGFDVTLPAPGGVRNVALAVKNTGANALSACAVQAVDGSGLSPVITDLDTTSLATLAAGASKRVTLAGPLDRIRAIASCVAGTTLRVVAVSGNDA